MNDIQGLRRLLQSLDLGDEPTPPFADELWEELDAAYDAAVATPLQPANDDSDTVVVVDFDSVSPPRYGRRRVLVAAAVAAGFIALALAGPRLPTRSVDIAGPLDPPALVVSSEQACFQFRASEPSVSDLVAAIASEEPISLDDVQVVREALDQLRAALEVADSDADTLSRYATGSALLGQVELEVERRLLSQAGRTLASAQQAIELDDIFVDGRPQPDPCTAP